MTGSIGIKGEENVSETLRSRVGHDHSISSIEIVSMKRCQEYTKIIFLHWFHRHRLVIINEVMIEVCNKI